MISIEMSGDHTFTEFAADRRELNQKLDSACAWLVMQGYRRIKWMAQRLVAESRNGCRVIIQITDDRFLGDES